MFTTDSGEKLAGNLRKVAFVAPMRAELLTNENLDEFSRPLKVVGSFRFAFYFQNSKC